MNINEYAQIVADQKGDFVMDCWGDYETALKEIKLPWRKGEPLTIPAKKTKIYAYLEVLLGVSKSQKSKIKEPNRDYTDKRHWNQIGRAHV